MKKHILKIALLLVVMCISAIPLVACNDNISNDDENDKTTPELSLSINEALMVTGESFTLEYTASGCDGKECEVGFVSDNECVAVDENGSITAESAGIAKITVTLKDSDKSEECLITVADIIVDSKANETNVRTSETPIMNIGGKYGETLFKTAKDALLKAQDGNVILIVSGKYNEKITITKSVTIKGKDSPKLMGVEVIEGVNATIEGLTFTQNEYPNGTSARVYIKSEATLIMKKCILSSNTTEQLEGGYGVFVEKQSGKIEIIDCTLSNFRYGIYICPTDGEVNISKNKLSNMDVGVGLDIRQENSDSNYPTMGMIDKNEYNEVKTKTQFLHHGDRFDGAFDFKDNELENAATDEGNTGGSGLTE